MDSDTEIQTTRGRQTQWIQTQRYRLLEGGRLNGFKTQCFKTLIQTFKTKT